MNQADARKQWEQAAPGWAKWEEHIDRCMTSATETMFKMAGVAPGTRVLDLACGAGSQTLGAARRVGARGEVVAADISESMLQYLSQRASDAQLDNISTMAGAADRLEIAPNSLDAAICRLGLMLFPDPARALERVKAGLKPGARMAVTVFSVPGKNAFMAKPMQILLRHAGKKPPAEGEPGIFALSAPGTLQHLFTASGFTEYDQRPISATLRARSTAEALEMMQEAFGAYRAVINDSPEAVRKAAWNEVAQALQEFETPRGFEASLEVIVGAGARPA